eukprot:TRINITY_DN55242_c0_g1_i1.p1 TRINITY_DN55242_c0_g1~~TRINITY_DN55242_c0_g1_i1.p1  ORF type:complete len:275 (+),score=51.42 TRINITY_DN55242_c0_g1_i1:18-842(+)
MKGCNNRVVLLQRLLDFSQKCLHEGEICAAIDTLEAACEQAVIVGDVAKEYQACGMLVAAHNAKGEWDLAAKHAKRSLNAARLVGNCIGEIAALENLATLQAKLTQYSDAADNFEKSLLIRKEIQHEAGLASTYSHLGNIYYQQDKFSQVVECHKKALEHSRQVSDRDEEATALANLAGAYNCLGNFDQAVGAAEDALRIGLAPVDEAAVHEHLGSSFRGLLDFSNAVREYETAIRMAETSGNPSVLAAATANLSSVQAQIAATAQPSCPVAQD